MKKCSKCDGEMIEQKFAETLEIRLPEKRFGSNRLKLTPFICQKCGYVELYIK